MADPMVVVPVLAVLLAEAGYVGTDASVQVLEIFEHWSTQQAFFTRMVSVYAGSAEEPARSCHWSSSRVRGDHPF